MVEAIDTHTHFVPEQIPVEPGRNPLWPSIELRDASAAVMVGGKMFRMIDSRSWDARRRIHDMAEDGFAALVHDLGKGTTPREERPKHIAHEHRGVELVNGLCDRLRIPNDYRELAQVVTPYHGVYHRVEELRASTLHDTLEAVDAFRRPERFEQFLLACEADSRGRTAFEEHHFAQPGLMREAFRAANQIGAKAVVADGYSGKAVGEQLRLRRIEAIRQARKLTQEETNG